MLQFFLDIYGQDLYLTVIWNRLFQYVTKLILMNII